MRELALSRGFLSHSSPWTRSRRKEVAERAKEAKEAKAKEKEKAQERGKGKGKGFLP